MGLYPSTPVERVVLQQPEVTQSIIVIPPADGEKEENQDKDKEASAPEDPREDDLSLMQPTSPSSTTTTTSANDDLDVVPAWKLRTEAEAQLSPIRLSRSPSSPAMPQQRRKRSISIRVSSDSIPQPTTNEDNDPRAAFARSRTSMSLSALNVPFRAPRSPSKRTTTTTSVSAAPASPSMGKEGVFTMRSKDLTVVPEEILQMKNNAGDKKLKYHTIYIDNNKITALPKDLGALQGLTALSVANNKLTSLPSEVWTLSSLTFLNVSKNRLRVLPDNVALTATIKFLFLDKTDICNVPPGFIANATSLKIFSVKDNMFEGLPDLPVICSTVPSTTTEESSGKEKEAPLTVTTAIAAAPDPQTLRGLDVLDVRGNLLSRGRFAKLRDDYLMQAGLHVSLTYLNVSRNCLTELPDALALLNNLRKLKFSFNSISKLQDTFCGEWKYLAKLKMNCNDFKEVPVQLLSFPRLVKVKMSGNPFILPHLQGRELRTYKRLPSDEKERVWLNPRPEYMENGIIDMLEERGCICRHILVGGDIPDRIMPNLYLGSQNCALSKHVLKHLGITHILSLLDLRPAYPEMFKYKVFAVIDKKSENLMQYFEDCNAFIHQGRRKGNAILVHCRAGVSRSATVCIAYLMRHRHLELPAALEYVLQRRCIINPNPGFRAQLKKYESFIHLNSALPF